MRGAFVYTIPNRIKVKAANHNLQVRGWQIADGYIAELIVDGSSTYSEPFTHWRDLNAALLDALEGDTMNILSNDKLFPNIRGVMLKDKPMTKTMSGKVVIQELQGGDARAEIFFTDSTKTAIINRTQLLKIVDLYGPETDEWKGKKITLYGEHGVWFGKKQWGLRVKEESPK